MKRSTRNGAAALVTLFFSTLYYWTPTCWFSYDGIICALNVEFGPLANLFHPNHLLVSFVSRGLYQGFIALGLHLRAVFVLQQINAVLGGLTVGVLFWILDRDMGWKKALLGAAALGFSNAFWTEMVDPGVYAWATLAACVLLGLLLDADQLPAGWVGAAHGVCVLFHQMFLLVVPAFLARLQPRQKKIYLAALIAVVGAGYGAVSLAVFRGSIPDTLLWMFGPAGQASHELNFFHWWNFNVGQAVIASWKAFVHGFIVSAPVVWMTVLEHGAGLGVVGFLLLGSWRYFQGKIPLNDRLGALWVWILLLSLFLLFYLPGAYRFRLLFMPPLIYLTAALTRPSRSLRGPAVAALAIGLMALFNFRQVIQPQSRVGNSPSLVRSLWLAQTLQPQDAFIFSGTVPQSITNVYVAYFAPQINGRSVRGYFFATPGGDLSTLRDIITASRKAHQRIFIEAALWDSQVQAELETIGQVPPGTLGKWLAGYKVRKQWPGPGGYSIYEVG